MLTVVLSVVVWGELSLNNTVRLRDLSVGGVEVLEMGVYSLGFLECLTPLIKSFIETILLIVSFKGDVYVDEKNSRCCGLGGGERLGPCMGFLLCVWVGELKVIALSIISSTVC